LVSGKQQADPFVFLDGVEGTIRIRDSWSSGMFPGRCATPATVSLFGADLIFGS
jgi:hypothetical protein